MAEDENKENIAPAGYVPPVAMNRGLAMKKGLSVSSRPLSEIQTNTLPSASTTTLVRFDTLVATLFPLQAESALPLCPKLTHCW